MATTVNVVRRKGNAALVEWRDPEQGKRRSIVPVAEVQSDESGEQVEDPEQGIPYGEQWEEWIEVAATPQAVARELRRMGIWTVEDLLARPQRAVTAFRTVYGSDASRLTQIARNELRKRGQNDDTEHEL